MKKTTIIYFILTFGFLIGCQEDFLQKDRQTEVSPERFFKKANDYKLYVNRFYNELGEVKAWSIGIYGKDNGTDNQISQEPNRDLNGEIVNEALDEKWTEPYGFIRGINIMLENTHKAEWDDIKVYVAEGKFFRALFYFKLMKRFGAVPWINKSLDPDDTEGLETPRSPRDVIADSIVADLDFAIANLPEKSEVEKLRISKEAALAFKSRVCLFEGTWEKYHAKENTPFKVEGADGTKFLQQAVDAAGQIMSGGKFEIDKSSGEAYYKLFNQEDYSRNKEVIFWRRHLTELQGRSLSRSIYLGTHNRGLTKNLVDTYLFADGKPLSLTSMQVSEGLSEVTNNRDPRLAQTIFNPGVALRIDDGTGDVLQEFEFTNLAIVRSGYQFRKGGSVLESDIAVNGDQLGHIYFRYAEVLLNYIEAKAELFESGKGSLSQADFDNTINKIRVRVNMPAFNFGSSIEDTQNPFTGKIPWYLVEIRRERRVELVIEGFRKDDIFRWAAAGDLVKGKIFRGAKYQWFVDNGYYEPTSVEYVDNDGYLSPWYNSGFAKAGGYQFNLGRDYLFPVATQEMLLGGYESNNPGWN